MFKTFLSNLKPLALSVLISGSGAYSYLYIQTYQNQKKWLARVEDPMTHDNTRETNEYFGINWGYAADDMIKTQIDTGDLLFLKQDCSQTFSPMEYITCYKQQLLNDQSYDEISVALRNDEDLTIYGGTFKGLHKTEYSEFLSKPFVQELSFRKLKCDKKFQNQKILNSSKNFDQFLEGSSTGEQMITLFLQDTGILRNDINQIYIDNLDQRFPEIFETCNLDSKINIRTKSNVQINDSL